MIPSYLRFGYTINSWIWMILLIFIIKDKTLLQQAIEKHTEFLLRYNIVLVILLLAIIFDIILGLITTHYYWKTYDDDDDDNEQIKIGDFS